MADLAEIESLELIDKTIDHLDERLQCLNEVVQGLSRELRQLKGQVARLRLQIKGDQATFADLRGIWADVAEFTPEEIAAVRPKLPADLWSPSSTHTRSSGSCRRVPVWVETPGV